MADYSDYPGGKNFNGPLAGAGCVPLGGLGAYPTASGLSTVDYDALTKALGDNAELRAVRQVALDWAMDLHNEEPDEPEFTLTDRLEMAATMAAFIWNGDLPSNDDY